MGIEPMVRVLQTLALQLVSTSVCQFYNLIFPLRHFY